MKKIVIGMVLILSMIGCTQNQKAKSFGGTATITLEKGKKLEVVTWKGEELWYLVRDRKEGEEIETYEFIEDSSFGLLEGKVIIKEQ